jgi:GxxExxY protein
MITQRDFGDNGQGAKDPLTQKVIGCAIEVHRRLGPGLLESTYQQCLVRELHLAGVTFQAQVPVSIEYKGATLDCGYRADLLIGGELIVELKAVEHLLPIHEAQLITYLKLADVPKGLLLNFNVKYLKDGIRRLFPSPSPR